MSKYLISAYMFYKWNNTDTLNSVLDGFFKGIRSTHNSHHYYNQGYDFGLVMWNKQQGDDK